MNEQNTQVPQQASPDVNNTPAAPVAPETAAPVAQPAAPVEAPASPMAGQPVPTQPVQPQQPVGQVPPVQQPYPQQGMPPVQPPMGQMPPAQYPAPQFAPAQNNTKAIISLVAGIASVILIWIWTYIGLGGAIAAIILGVMGRKEAGPNGKKGMATAGIVLGIITLVLFVLIIILAVAFAASFLGSYNYYSF